MGSHFFKPGSRSAVSGVESQMIRINSKNVVKLAWLLVYSPGNLQFQDVFSLSDGFHACVSEFASVSSPRSDDSMTPLLLCADFQTRV